MRAAAVSYPQAGHDTSGRIADDVHRRSAGILLDATGNLAQMFGLAPKITGAIAQRLHDDSRPASGAQLAASGSSDWTLPPLSRHQEDRAELSARPVERIHRLPDNGDHGDRHDHQQRRAGGTEHQASALGESASNINGA